MPRQPAPAIASAPSRLVLAFAVVAALSACDKQPPAVATDPVVAAAINEVVAQGVHALKTKNVDEYLAQVPDEAIPIDSSFKGNQRDRVYNELKLLWSQIYTEKLAIRVDSVIAHGDSATVVTTMFWDRYEHYGPSRKDRLVTNATHREIWRKTKDGWRSFKLLSQTSSTTRNGVPTGS